MPWRQRPPFRRRKKRNFKKRKTTNRPPRSVQPTGIYRFKRDIDELVSLAGTPDSWTLNSDKSLAKTFAFALNSVGDYSDFQNLFKYYRLRGARVRMYFSNTVSRSDQGSPNEPSNRQIMIQLDSNQDGVGVPTINDLLTSQTKKRFVALQGTRKPSVDIYMPLKQATDMYATSGAPTALVFPKWLNTSSTEAAQTPHYGFNINMGRMDKGEFSAGLAVAQYVRIITTLYIECKKVQ